MTLGSINSIYGSNAVFSVSGSQHAYFSALGTVTSLTVSSFDVPAPVPEPETYAMLLAGIGLVGFAAGRKRTTV
ncbi:PEP-CTERM sorting domain-containing protein [Duganella aquatilis]|uniref:PEP-CTERM sorting domain-containing protein n=1 Tax=Duganella aquatilis TaxID=2666082 RepID=UPI002277326D|nr:PEP-CTERM sorting domain-containing protein [Duganella aquatilis]